MLPGLQVERRRVTVAQRSPPRPRCSQDAWIVGADRVRSACGTVLRSETQQGRGREQVHLLGHGGNQGTCTPVGRGLAWPDRVTRRVPHPQDTGKLALTHGTQRSVDG